MKAAVKEKAGPVQRWIGTETERERHRERETERERERACLPDCLFTAHVRAVCQRS